MVNLDVVSNVLTESQYGKPFVKQIYYLCLLLICDDSWSLGILGRAFLDTDIKTYFKLY